MTTTAPPARWRDFAHTASVKIAQALAAHEARAGVTAAPPGRVVRQTFAFALLAASTGEAPVLPTGGYEAADGGLMLTTVVAGGQISIALQLEGLEALETGAGCAARLVSDNGVLDAVVTFDGMGRASLALADTEAHRVALTKMRVDVLTEPEG